MTASLASTAKVAPSLSPPILLSPDTQSSSLDSTSITTPSTHCQSSFPASRPQKHLGLFPPFHSSEGHATEHDHLLFPLDDDDLGPPLFFHPLPHPPSVGTMPGSASPIDIATARPNSTSPPTQQSNLTSQLKGPRIDIREDSFGMSNSNRQDSAAQRARQESIGMLGSTPYGSRAIPVGGRENNQLSGSMVGGMSWGGISMGSFIRDE